MMKVHLFHDVDLPKPGSGTRSTRSLSVTVECVMILLEAKSMMTIDFDKNVGQRVRHRQHFGQKCLRKTCDDNTTESEAKAVSAGWSDVMDVISWCYVQWCDGLARATSVSSRAARMRRAVSEAARRIVRLRSHGEVGRVSVCLFRWETLHQDTKTISSARRVATSYWIGRALLQGWS